MAPRDDHQEFRRAVGNAYDALGENYGEVRETEGGHLEQGTLPAVRAFGADLPADSLVLDAGCGPGVAAARLADRHSVVGLDLSAKQLALAGEAVPPVALCRGDLTALPFETDSFDALLELHATIHVPREQHRRVYEEFARVLRSGGHALLTVRADDWEGSNPDWLGTGVEMRWSFPGRERSVERLDSAGFEVVSSVYYDSEAFDCLRLVLQ